MWRIFEWKPKAPVLETSRPWLGGIAIYFLELLWRFIAIEAVTSEEAVIDHRYGFRDGLMLVFDFPFHLSVKTLLSFAPADRSYQ